MKSKKKGVGLQTAGRLVMPAMPVMPSGIFILISTYTQIVSDDLDKALSETLAFMFSKQAIIGSEIPR